MARFIIILAVALVGGFILGANIVDTVVPLTAIKGM